MVMDFDAIYAGANPDMREILKQFRAAHPEKHTTVNDAQWDYLTGGEGDSAILWLVGGLRAADAAFRSIPVLEDQFRIIAPTYPPVDTMDALADGLAGVLDAEGVENAHILAGSFGGMLAQVFVRRHPERVDKLILSTTTAPNPDLAAKYQQDLSMISNLPEDVIREGAKQRFYDIVSPPEAEGDFWRAYFEELFSYRLGKADLLSTYHCMIQFHRIESFKPDDLKQNQGNALIIDSDNDTTFGNSAAEVLRALYPDATTHTFTGAGHSPGSNQRDLYFSLVRKFLTD